MLVSDDQSSVIDDKNSHKNNNNHCNDQVENFRGAPNENEHYKPKQAIYRCGQTSSHELHITFGVDCIRSEDNEHSSGRCGSLVDGLNLVE